MNSFDWIDFQKSYICFKLSTTATASKSILNHKAVQGDEQPDRPNSQTCLECCNACAAHVLIYPDLNSLSLGPIQPSSPDTKELHVLGEAFAFSEDIMEILNHLDLSLM